MEYFAGRAATGFVIPEWLPIPDNVQYNRAVSKLDSIVYDIIAKKKSEGNYGEDKQVGAMPLLGSYTFLHASHWNNAMFPLLKLLILCQTPQQDLGIVVLKGSLRAYCWICYGCQITSLA